MESQWIAFSEKKPKKHKSIFLCKKGDNTKFVAFGFTVEDAILIQGNFYTYEKLDFSECNTLLSPST